MGVPSFDTSDLLDDRTLRGPEFCQALTVRIDEHLAEVFAAGRILQLDNYMRLRRDTGGPVYAK